MLVKRERAVQEVDIRPLRERPSAVLSNAFRFCRSKLRFLFVTAACKPGRAVALERTNPRLIFETRLRCR